MPTNSVDLDPNIALVNVQKFKRDKLKTRLSVLESTFHGKTMDNLNQTIDSEGLNSELLASALLLKTASSQINEVVHALGILRSLPLILDSGESIESLSLGAGNTGRPFDLETNIRVAEFKFIEWKGADAVRQDSLFKDFYELAEYPTDKRKYLYVVGTDYPIKFLTGGRACRSVMSRHQKTWKHFEQKYGESYQTVSQYFQYRQTTVQIVDLGELLPELLLS